MSIRAGWNRVRVGSSRLCLTRWSVAKRGGGTPALCQKIVCLKEGGGAPDLESKIVCLKEGGGAPDLESKIVCLKEGGGAPDLESKIVRLILYLSWVQAFWALVPERFS